MDGVELQELAQLLPVLPWSILRATVADPEVALAFEDICFYPPRVDHNGCSWRYPREWYVFMTGEMLRSNERLDNLLGLNVYKGRGMREWIGAKN